MNRVSFGKPHCFLILSKFLTEIFCEGIHSPLAFFDLCGRMAIQILLEVLPMAYKITSACVSCGSCADVWPAGVMCQGDDQYVIDAAACLDCGSCSDTCPNGAIVPEE